MMFSGHTYFCGVFSLGLYDLFRNATANLGWGTRLAIRFIIGAALAALVLFDVVLILMNRFHYTMDCAIAIVLVLLIYSNPAVAVAVEWYMSRWEPPRCACFT